MTILDATVQTVVGRTRAENRYDVVIVGARCAGAALATFLARSGARVLLLEKDRRGDGPAAVDSVDSSARSGRARCAGRGPAVRSVTPPSRIVRLDGQGVVADLELSSDRPALCPRRQRLDGALQHAAARRGPTSTIWPASSGSCARAVAPPDRPAPPASRAAAWHEDPDAALRARQALPVRREMETRLARLARLGVGADDAERRAAA